MGSSEFDIPSSSPKVAARGKKRKNEATQPQQPSKKSKTAEKTTSRSKGTGKLPSIGKHRALSVAPQESANKGQRAMAKNQGKKAAQQAQKKVDLLKMSSDESSQDDIEMVPATQREDKPGEDRGSAQKDKPIQPRAAATTNGHNEVEDDSTDISSDDDDLQASFKEPTPRKNIDHQKKQRPTGLTSTVNKFEQNGRKSDSLVDDAALHDNLIVGFNKAGPRTKTHPTALKDKPATVTEPEISTGIKKKPTQSEQLLKTKTSASSKRVDLHEASRNVAHSDEDALAAFIASPHLARNRSTPTQRPAKDDAPGSTPGNPLEVLDNTSSEDDDDLNGRTQPNTTQAARAPRNTLIKLEPGHHEEQRSSQNKKGKPASILKTKTTSSNMVNASPRSVNQVPGLALANPPLPIKDSGYGAAKPITSLALMKPPATRMQANNTATDLKRKISAAGSPLLLEKRNGVDNEGPQQTTSDADIESLRDMPTPDPKVLEAQFRKHKNETVKKQTQPVPGALAVRTSDGCPDFDEILEWRGKLATHQRYLFDQLAGDAKDIINYLIRQEGRLAELIEQFRNRGEHLVKAMGQSHVEGAVQYRSDRERTKASQ